MGRRATTRARISEKLPKQVSSNAAKQTEAEESESAPERGNKLTNCQQIEAWRKIYTRRKANFRESWENDYG